MNRARVTRPEELDRPNLGAPVGRKSGCVTLIPSPDTVAESSDGSDGSEGSEVSDSLDAGGPPRATRRRRPQPPSFRMTWLRFFLVLFALCVAWAFATPLAAAPDEPAQIVKAAATVRGEFTGLPTPKEPAAVREFRVPTIFDSIYHLPICYQFHPKIPAGCAPHLASSGRVITSTSYVGRYPPLYYAAVGIPTLFMHSESVVYVMRIVSACIDALLLSLALTIATLRCRSSMLLEGIAIAVTPLVIFLSGVVNPSGFEIAAAICAWASGLALVRNDPSQPARSVLVTFIISGCLLELTRGLSVLWLGLILVTLVCLEPRSCGRLVRRWSVRIGIGALGIVGAIAVTFVVRAQTLKILPSTAPLPTHRSFIVLTDQVLGRFGGYAREAIGVFGWLDTPSPLLTIFVWTALIGFLVIAGLAASRWHERAVLIGLMTGVFLVTLVLIEEHAATAGITWQSRDGFPLYAGIPLVAGVIIQKRSILRFGDLGGSHAVSRSQTAAIVAIAIGICQLADFVWTLRRYTVGLGRTVNLFHHVKGGWSPPLGIPLMVAVGVVAVVLYAVQLYSRMRS
jgi:hypothetical protein